MRRRKDIGNNKELLLLIDLERVIRPFTNNLKSIVLQLERLFTSGNTQDSCQSFQEDLTFQTLT